MKIYLSDLQKSYLLGNDNSCTRLNAYAYFEYEFSFDISKLQYAINKIIAKHPILRAAVDSCETLTVQDDMEEFGLNLFDFTNLRIEDKINLFLKEGKNFKQGYLFDINISDYENPKLGLIFSILISDIETQKQIYNDLIYFYNCDAITPDCKNNLDVSSVFNFDDLKKSPLYSKSKFFWDEKLNSLSNFPKIPNFENSTSTGDKILRKSKILSPDTLHSLIAIGRKNNVSIPSLIYTVYAKSLSDCLGTKRFYLPMLFDKRKFYKIKNNIAGNFSDLILLEFDFGTEEDLFDKIRKTQRDFWSKIENCYYSGVEVVNDINIRNEVKKFNLIPFLISINTDFKNDNQFNFEHNSMVFSTIQRPNVLLDLQVNQNRLGTEIVFYYQSGVFTEVLVDNILNDLIINIDSIE